MISAAEPPKLSRNEGLKGNNTTLAGTIAQTLADPSVDRFSDDDYEFLKFHGIYQQDDRDKRKVAKHYMLMVRTKFPGGVLSSKQHRAGDGVATTSANATLRITTCQDFHCHCMLTADSRPTRKALRALLITTF